MFNLRQFWMVVDPSVTEWNRVGRGGLELALKVENVLSCVLYILYLVF